MRTAARIALLALVICGRLPASSIDPASGNVSPLGPVNGYALAWSDEFNGEGLDQTKWGYRTDSKMWSTQLPANVSVADGHLVLALKKEKAGGKAYTGAGIVSRAVFRYGYYEARLQVTSDTGWHTSFWTIPYEGFSHSSSDEGRQELDIVENNSVHLRYYGINTQSWLAPHRIFSPKYVVPTSDLSATFHVFGCEFTPQTVRYFFDGTKVHEIDATLFRHGDQNILLTVIASSLGATKAVDDAKLPSASLVDYVCYFAPMSATMKIP
jgi:beta-glucanase (GH16 family)